MDYELQNDNYELISNKFVATLIMKFWCTPIRPGHKDIRPQDMLVVQATQGSFLKPFLLQLLLLPLIHLEVEFKLFELQMGL